MKQKVTNTLALMLLVIASVIVPAAPVAAVCTGGNTSKGQILQGVGETGNECNGHAVPHTLQVVVELLGYIAGVVAIIMIVIAGFKYITSNGDSGKVSSAKNTLLYAVIGVAVAALSQFFVHFVLARVG